MRILSGIQPSGRLHLGNYFGMMKPAIEMQEQGEAFTLAEVRLSDRKPSPRGPQPESVVPSPVYFVSDV